MPPKIVKNGGTYSVISEIANQCFIVHLERITAAQAERLMRRIKWLESKPKPPVTKPTRGLR